MAYSVAYISEAMRFYGAIHFNRGKSPMNIWSVLQTVLPAAIAFLSGLVGVYFGARRMRQEKRLEFRRQQLDQFYSPLVGMKEHIVHRARLKSRVLSAAEDEWRNIAQRHDGQLDWDHEAAYEPFGAITDYNNKQLTEDILPLYRRMLELFKDNYHLMEVPTRQFYGPLYEFIELWDRWISDSLPAGVMERVNHDGSFLEAIGTDALSHIDEIRAELLLSSHSNSGPVAKIEKEAT